MIFDIMVFGFLIIFDFSFCKTDYSGFKTTNIKINPGILPVTIESIYENMDYKYISYDPFYNFLRIFIYILVIAFIIFLIKIIYNIIKNKIKRETYIVENEKI